MLQPTPFLVAFYGNFDLRGCCAARGSSGPLLLCLSPAPSGSYHHQGYSCQVLLFNAWYLDDGVVAGPSSSVQHVIHLLQDLGSSLGLHLNPPKCELFSQGDLSLFPSDMKKSYTPNLTILGAPIGDMWPFAHPLLPPNVLLLLPYCYPHWRSLAHVILRLLSFCYTCVVDLQTWSTLHGPWN